MTTLISVGIFEHSDTPTVNIDLRGHQFGLWSLIQTDREAYLHIFKVPITTDYYFPKFSVCIWGVLCTELEATFVCAGNMTVPATLSYDIDGWPHANKKKHKTKPWQKISPRMMYLADTQLIVIFVQTERDENCLAEIPIPELF